jgi:hypothetical protein
VATTKTGAGSIRVLAPKDIFMDLPPGASIMLAKRRCPSANFSASQERHSTLVIERRGYQSCKKSGRHKPEEMVEPLKNFFQLCHQPNEQ